MPRRSYSGSRATTAADGSPHWLDRGTCQVYVAEGKRLWELEEPPSARQDNEAAWDWGANCDGAHRLALALLTDALASRERALKLCGAYLFQVVRDLPYLTWLLWASDVVQWAEAWERDHGVRAPAPS